MAARYPFRRLWRPSWLAVFGCALFILWTGCAGKSKYEVLSFFFDGVPDPNAPAGPLIAGQRARGVVYSHKPYAEGNCNACHTRGMNSIFEATTSLEIDPHVCLKCHAKVLGEFPVMHGPVVAVECLLCHAPHESNSPYLLAGPSPNICLQCHVPELLSPRPPEHLNLKISCLDCHVGHGGEMHGLLRANRTVAPIPTTGPAAVTPRAMAQLGGRQLP